MEICFHVEVMEMILENRNNKRYQEKDKVASILGQQWMMWKQERENYI